MPSKQVADVTHLPVLTGTEEFHLVAGIVRDGGGNVTNHGNSRHVTVAELATFTQETSLQKASNLSDVASASTARANLGVYSTAEVNALAFAPGPAAATAGSVMQIDKVHTDGVVDPSIAGGFWTAAVFCGTAFGKRFTAANAPAGASESPAIAVLNYAEAFGSGCDVVAHMAISYARANGSVVFGGNDIATASAGLTGVRYVAREFDIQPPAGSAPANGCGGALFNAFSVAIPGNATQVDGVFGGSWANGHVVYSTAPTGAAFAGGAGGSCGSLTNSGTCTYTGNVAHVVSNTHRIQFSGSASTHWQMYCDGSNYFHFKIGANPLVFENVSDTGGLVVMDTNGTLAIGATASIAAGYKLDVAADVATENSGIGDFKGSDGSVAAEVRTATGSVGNAAACAMRLRANSSTSRSINAGGTINASGADYAEYERLADGVGRIAKGAVVGFRSDGLLTDRFADAVRFGVKSTAPNLVGGDNWTDHLAAAPIPPRFDPPPYGGIAEPSPDAPQAKVSDEEAAARIAAGNALGELVTAKELGASPDSLAPLEAATAAAQEAIARLRSARFAKTDELAAQWEADKIQRVADVAAYDAELAASRAAWEANELAAYNAANAAYQAAVDEARAPMERIAYCGKVPANLVGAKPGQFVIAVADGAGGIAMHALDYPATTAEQRDLYCLGRVNKVLADGRAEVVVKPV